MTSPEVVTQLRHHHVGPMARPDEVLVEGLRRRGDRGGGGAGGHKRGPGLRLAMRITGNQSDAEQVTQDALWAAAQD
jgi:hypothetical protein